MAISSDQRRIAHLLRRAGFGASPGEISVYLGLGFDAAVDRLVDYDRVPNDDLDAQLAALEAQLDMTKLPAIQTVWLYRMLRTARPLEEKMTLFWHDHFATANAKVGRPPAMYAQNQLLRANAMGDFPTMLKGVSRDPAMLRWLDNNANRKSSPNENYARELMELFTMGPGNYTEEDVREGARAFTGWFFTREGAFAFNRNQHDPGNKTFLGRTGPWDGDDIIDIILEQPVTARFIAEKLFAFFVHDHPSPTAINRLADVFRGSGYSIRELVRAILRSPEFSSDDAYHALVKSPVEVVVGMLKAFEVGELQQGTPAMLNRMGMALFNPPNVAGWNWGTGWIGSATLLERVNASNQITIQRGDNVRYGMDPTAVTQKLGARTAQQVVDGLLDLLVDGDVSPAARGQLVQYMTAGYTGAPEAFLADRQRADRTIRGVAHLIMSMPVYQMA
jgi:uncharacterized protein (DUF1800 family)